MEANGHEFGERFEAVRLSATRYLAESLDGDGLMVVGILDRERSPLVPRTILVGSMPSTSLRDMAQVQAQMVATLIQHVDTCDKAHTGFRERLFEKSLKSMMEPGTLIVDGRTVLRRD